MKMLKNLVLAFGVSAVLASPAFAQESIYKKDWEVKDFLEEVNTVDCSKDAEKCRYYSVLELTALHQACVAPASEKMQKLASEINKNWVVFKDEKLKQAIYNGNPFLDSLTLRSQLFIRYMPTENAKRVCGNVAQIKNQVIPEKISILFDEKNHNEQKIIYKDLDEKDKSLYFTGKDAENAIKANNNLLKSYEDLGEAGFI